MRLHKSGEDYKEKKYPAIMLAGSVLCALFAGLCWKEYKKR